MSESIESLQHKLSHHKANYKRLVERLNAVNTERDNLIDSLNDSWGDIDCIKVSLHIERNKQMRLIDLCNTSCWRYKC